MPSVCSMSVSICTEIQGGVVLLSNKYSAELSIDLLVTIKFYLIVVA